MISALRIAVLLAAGSLALFGCNQESGTSSGLPESGVRDPAALARQGLHEEAAAAWLAKAEEAPGPESATLRLRAAEAWWRAGRRSHAGEMARVIEPSSLRPADSARRALLLARVALAGGAAREAFDALPSLEAMLTSPEPAAALELAVRAAHMAERPIDEIRFRIALDSRLGNPDANRETLWGLLRSLPDEPLRDLRANARGAAAGWLELEQIARAHRVDFRAFSAALQHWSERHPEHPAGSAIVPGLVETIRKKGSPPGHVALLLPLSGTFASAAAAVRDGFLAGWYTAPGDRPTVSIFDTGRRDPEELFRAAVERGADFVVGPLSKTAIGRVASLADRGVPVLLLNAFEDGFTPTGGEPTYRYALSPEDEARAVADYARRNGHSRAGVIVPESAWGERVADAFTRHFEASGAIVAAHTRYQGAAEDLAGPVRELLDLDAAEARARKLRRTLRRSIRHESLPRGDLDFIFLAGFPREARRLRPQISFLRAADLPVYATSHVFGGVPAPQRDLDLEGIVFYDMPWVLGPPSAGDRLRERIVEQWPAASEGFIRYYAFGIDAYRLQRELFRLAARPEAASISGRTGRLSVREDGRIRVEMAWARFRDGTPEPISP
ncbi:MAG: penicillin-binding protein activator [Immundisolibacterales bacterium]|nr:penicillin-binding protein activator [Immundisolibacterales bacterium]